MARKPASHGEEPRTSGATCWKCCGCRCRRDLKSSKLQVSREGSCSVGGGLGTGAADWSRLPARTFDDTSRVSTRDSTDIGLCLDIHSEIRHRLFDSAHRGVRNARRPAEADQAATFRLTLRSIFRLPHMQHVRLSFISDPVSYSSFKHLQLLHTIGGLQACPGLETFLWLSSRRTFTVEESLSLHPEILAIIWVSTVSPMLSGEMPSLPMGYGLDTRQQGTETT